MFNILANTHKVIATIVHQKIKRDFNIELNLKKIQWGSVCPDVLPYYKLIRHYQNESIDYISNEISNLIYFFQLNLLSLTVLLFFYPFHF